MKKLILVLSLTFISLNFVACSDEASVNLNSFSLDSESYIPLPGEGSEEPTSSAEGTPGESVIPLPGQEEPAPEPAPTPTPTPEPAPTPTPEPTPAPPVACAEKPRFILESGNLVAEVSPHMSPLPADVNYNYYSWSAHPIVGSSPKGYEGQFFLYEDLEGEMTLNFIFSVDAGGSPDNKVLMDVQILNNKSDDQIVLSDDRMEIKKLSSAAGESLYQAKFRYWKNTDGGVLGGLKGEDLKIKINMTDIGDNRSLKFYDSNGEVLDVEKSLVIYRKGVAEDCGVHINKEEKRNQCLEKEYLSRRDLIQEAKWLDKYDQMIKERKITATKIKKEQKEERLALTKILNEKVKKEKLKISEIKKEQRLEILKTNKDFKIKMKELHEKFKVKRSDMVKGFDVKIQEIQKQESETMCTQQKGFIGFLKRLVCKVVRFVAKVVSVIFRGFDEMVENFLIRCGLMDVNISSSQDLIQVKTLALEKLDQEFEVERKKLIAEHKEKLKQITEHYKLMIAEQIKAYKLAQSERSKEISVLVSKQKQDYKRRLVEINKKITIFKRNAIKHQDAIHKEFGDAARKCL